jgi:MFS transporter, PAT family, beta-lactamase induction signal transducer AmpG
MSARLAAARRLPPIWILGMAGLSFGFVGGYVAFALPQALAARHVPEPAIATASAIALSPSFYAFLLSPMLDVWWSRRTYALLLWTLAAILTAASTLLLGHLQALEIVAALGFAANQLASAALGGWLSTVCGRDQENSLSAWLTVSNIAGFGLFAIAGGELLRNLSSGPAAVLIALLILAPLAILPWIPAAAPDHRLVGESFRQFLGDLWALLRRREVLVAIALFVAPCATFSLTNMVGGFGADFSVSPRTVSLLGGAGVTVAGVCGSLMLPPLARRMPLRILYLSIGVGGSLFTMLMLLLPHVPSTFALLVLGENTVQACAIACSLGITFEAIGAQNPLAATNYAVLNAAYNVPITYMLLVDGSGYERWGVAGALAVDALVGLIACLALGLLIALLAQRRVPQILPAD